MLHRSSVYWWRRHRSSLRTTAALILAAVLAPSKRSRDAVAEHKTWKRSLSLWQQGTCVRYFLVEQKDGADAKIIRRTLYMRPIFSGATVGSSRDHSIQWWLDNGGKFEDVEVLHVAQ